MSIFIAEGMHQAGVIRLKDQGLPIVTTEKSFAKDEVQVLVVRSVFQVNGRTIKDFPNLKVVAKLGTGLDNIDQEACAQNNVRVLSAPAMNSVSTAEFAVTQILNFFKNSFEIYARVKERDFRRHLYFGRELSELSAGIIGYGSVGQNIAKCLKPFVKDLYVLDRNQPQTTQKEGLHFVGHLNDLLAEADIIVLAVSLKNNEAMVNGDFLAQLKSNALLVNIARGGLVDEAALIKFLKRNPQVFYICDVLKNEPDYTRAPESQDYQNPLLDLPNVLFTPHIAGMTEESQQKIAVAIADKILSLNYANTKDELCVPEK